jgi:hypothetical protein
MKGFFDGVVQEPFDIRGFPARAPLFYRDLHMMAGIFLADLAAVRAALPSMLRPLVPLPGQALVGINCFEYKDTDIGPYNEVSISVALRSRRCPLLDAALALRAALLRRYEIFVLDLPVSTDVAVHGGVDVFNYPKYRAAIRFEERGGERTCEVLDARTGELILGFAGDTPRAPSSPRSVITSDSFPLLEGVPVRARVRINPLEMRGLLLGDHLRVRLGRHARAEGLRRLRLGRLVQYLYIPRGEAILYRPTPAREGP